MWYYVVRWSVQVGESGEDEKQKERMNKLSSERKAGFELKVIYILIETSCFNVNTPISF